MKNYIREIRKNTEGMTGKERAEYICAYYWYHLLGAAAIFCLVIFLIIHFGFGEEQPLFTCVMVNQRIDQSRDEQMEEEFADSSDIEDERIIFDSDFNISYGDVQLEGINESSYEKFFFKWQNQELDAVIMPESFYQYCKELGGSFRSLDEEEIQGLPVYRDEGTPTAIKAEETCLSKYLDNETGEMLLLAFPDTGKHEKECREFVDFLSGEEGAQFCRQ